MNDMRTIRRTTEAVFTILWVLVIVIMLYGMAVDHYDYKTMRGEYHEEVIPDEGYVPLEQWLEESKHAKERLDSR